MERKDRPGDWRVNIPQINPHEGIYSKEDLIHTELFELAELGVDEPCRIDTAEGSFVFVLTRLAEASSSASAEISESSIGLFSAGEQVRIEGVSTFSCA